MRLTVFVLAAVLLTGCKQQPQQPPRQPQTSEALIARIHRELPGMTEECLDKLKWGGWDAMPTEIDQCFEMLPPQRWRGLWRRQFEAPFFCPVPAKDCASGTAKNILDLEFKQGFEPPGINADTPPGGLYAVEFIGRRTAHGFIYGDKPDAQAVVVDRLISFKEIEAPPKE